MRELLLIKVNVKSGERSELLEAVSIFRAKVIDLTPTSLTIEITGEQSKCNAFVEYLRPYNIAELVRTGVTAIERGNAKLSDKKPVESNLDNDKQSE
jgi:acetolactate synthase-1/3 small subunit